MFPGPVLQVPAVPLGDGAALLAAAAAVSAIYRGGCCYRGEITEQTSFCVLVTTASKSCKLSQISGWHSVELVLELLKRSVVMSSENKSVLSKG